MRSRKLSIEEFIMSIVFRVMKRKKDIFLVRKARHRLKNINSDDLIPIEDACKEAGWDV